MGYADNYMKVQFEGNDSLIGQIVKVKIAKADYPINKGKVVRIVEHATNKSEEDYYNFKIYNNLELTIINSYIILSKSIVVSYYAMTLKFR